jgi:hypothetical protein
MNEAVAFWIALAQAGQADPPYAWIALLGATALAGVGAIRHGRPHRHSDPDFIPHHVIRDDIARHGAPRR